MRTLFVLLFGLVALAAQAQPVPPTQKIGYADWAYIFTQLPDFKQIDAEMKNHTALLENQLKAKYVEFQTKSEAYSKMAATTPDAIRKDKESELSQLQESIQKFQQDAQASLQKKNSDLMAPIYAKVGNAIADVAKEQGYSFILTAQSTAGEDILLYSDDKYNISVLVLKKMGITVTAATPVK